MTTSIPVTLGSSRDFKGTSWGASRTSFGTSVWILVRTTDAALNAKKSLRRDDSSSIGVARGTIGVEGTTRTCNASMTTTNN